MDLLPPQTEIVDIDTAASTKNPSSDGKSEYGNGYHLAPVLTQDSPTSAQNPSRSKTLFTSRRAFTDGEFWGGAHHKAWEKSPWVQLPLQEPDGRWIPEEQQATEWLSLFYGERELSRFQIDDLD